MIATMEGQSGHSQSSSICHASATTAILSSLFTDTVTISPCISVGSCTLNVYLAFDVVICIGGVRDSEGARLARAVGDGMDDADEAEALEPDFNTTGNIEGNVCCALL